MANAAEKKLHLVGPMQPELGIAERGFCGAKTRQLVGTWKCRAILFVTEAQWAAMCLSCRARAVEWMKANDASTVPCFAPVSSISTNVEQALRSFHGGEVRQRVTYEDIREEYEAALADEGVWS